MKRFVYFAFLCLGLLLFKTSTAQIKAHLDVKIFYRDGRTELRHLPEGRADCDTWGAVWDGIQALSNSINAGISFWGGDPINGALSAYEAYNDVRNLLNAAGDKTVVMNASTSSIDIDQTDHIDVTLYAWGGSGIGHCNVAVPRFPQFSIGPLKRSNEYRGAEQTVTIKCRGNNNLNGIIEGPYIVDFFAKEGSDAIVGDRGDGCSCCLAANLGVTIPLVSSSEQSLGRGLSGQSLETYRGYINQLATANINLQKTYSDEAVAEEALTHCGSDQACKSRQYTSIATTQAVRLIDQALVDDYTDKIYRLLAEATVGPKPVRHFWHRIPAEAKTKNIKRIN